MNSILKMGRAEILALDPRDVVNVLSFEEFKHIATVLGAYWSYDYQAAKSGKVGMHAILKSLLHSDGFFVSRILLEFENVCHIMAQQMVIQLRMRDIELPRRVAGVPDGAKKLGDVIAEILGASVAEMQKSGDVIQLVTPIPEGDSLLLVEDFCTRGTGFKQAFKDVMAKYPRTNIIPIDPVILNRGGLREFTVECGSRETVIAVVAAAERRINDWAAEECPLCKIGSVPIKPKVTDENWLAITTSQL